MNHDSASQSNHGEGAHLFILFLFFSFGELQPLSVGLGADCGRERKLYVQLPVLD